MSSSSSKRDPASRKKLPNLVTNVALFVVDVLQFEWPFAELSNPQNSIHRTRVCFTDMDYINLNAKNI